ncbi:hypothetical protein [Mycolicibacterium brumae]|uniref:Uncharacterized protein n=1 Tax=Mycolicibacterium brumae TaxID=85968 RepID=A0A2G5P876_9MYCO|nr:hypothetical protein [Mycolicibacterium brumae]MCV7194147.1 hypothetical protein [Mycolicibacterium brumae]PIB74457.1 hypothetical protein CQY22_013405 [Mycolicibacterium brumae]RWA22680.1 hypothetical protein MBRU_12070 [Mycolicibacterium brumae DSM 44177]UWW07513.1 hypothetical protein L2Z93_000530 [Mycolicibacterium brumae]
MSRLVELTGRRYLAARIAHVSGDVAWWVFVVGALLSEVDGYYTPRRYADYDESIFGVGLGQSDAGWTGYEPLTDMASRSAAITVMDTLAVCTAIALAVTVIAAVVEAVTVGRWPAGVATVVTPIVGAAVILGALHYRSGFADGLQLNMLVVFALVLLGVGVREVWSRVWAPRPQRRA